MRSSNGNGHCQIDIVELVESEGIPLRRQGRELVGLCPFHDDRQPSFAINPDKQVWHCFACAEGGDSIAFIEKFYGLNFRQAIKLLGIDSTRRRPPDSAGIEARRIAEWARATSNHLRDILHDIGDEIYLCGQLRKCGEFVCQREAELIREWAILCDLDDDLNAWKFVEFSPEEQQVKKKFGTWMPDARRVLELWRNHEDIKALLERLWESSTN